MKGLALINLISLATLLFSNGHVNEKINTQNHYLYRFERAFNEDLVTFEAWVNIDKDFSGRNGGVIFGNFYNSMYSYGDDFNIEVTKDGYLVFNYFVLTNYPVVARPYIFNSHPNLKINTGLDTHIAITRTTNSISLFINGEHKETGDFISSYTNHSKMRYEVGVDYKNWTSYPKEPLLGNVEQISLFSSVLTNEEIKDDYLNKTRSFTKERRSSTVGNWYFGNEWTQDVVFDTSENRNHALLCTQEKFIKVEETKEFDYTLVMFPDVQTSTHYAPSRYYSQVQWVIDSQSKLNIPMVNYVGDLVDNPLGAASTEDEWLSVTNGFDMYKKAGLTWGFCLGNHDYDGSGNVARETTGLDAHIDYNEIYNQKHFGGYFEEGSLENTYFQFVVDGVKYLYLNLEFGPRDQVIRWANRLIEANQDSRVIIFTHSYLTPASTLTGPDDHYSVDRYGLHNNTNVNNGQKLWDKCFSKHKNVFMVFSGHESDDDVCYQPLIGENGNVVYNFLIDAQGSFSSNGIDMVFMMKINESQKRAYCYWYCPSLGMYLNTQNQFMIDFGQKEITPLVSPSRLNIHKFNNNYLFAVIPTALVVTTIPLIALTKKKKEEK